MAQTAQPAKMRLRSGTLQTPGLILWQGIANQGVWPFPLQHYPRLPKTASRCITGDAESGERPLLYPRKASHPTRNLKSANGGRRDPRGSTTLATPCAIWPR